MRNRILVLPGRVRRFAGGAFCLALFALPLRPAASGGVPDPPTPSSRLISVRRQASGSDFSADFEKAWKTTRDRFYDRKLHGLDWEKVGAKYRERLKSVRTKSEFGKLMNAMLSELRASHTEYFTDDDMGFYMLPAVMNGDMEGRKATHIGVMGRHEESGFLVTGVMDGGAAEKAGVRVGDRLLSVEGEPFTTVGAFRGKEGKEVSLLLRREGEQATRAVRVVPVQENLLTAFLNATRKSARIIELDGRRIGYIHLWTMANETFRTALEQNVLGKLFDTDGLILDLRDGFGGRPFGYGNVFFQPEIRWESQLRGNGVPSTQRTGYGKPMVVLINEGTRSAKEFFTYQFKKAKRATVVGSTTAGAFLGAGGFEISKEGLLELAVVGLRIDGARLEGVGVAPDIMVPPSGSYTENDAQRKKAQEVLLEAIKKSGSQRRIVRGKQESARN